MSEESLFLTRQEIYILYALLKLGGVASFNEIMRMFKMCYGMFHNTAEKLIEKGLIERIDALTTYKITEKGLQAIKNVKGIELE